MPSLNEIVAIAKKAAQAAGEVQMRGLREGTTVRSKSQAHDLVTAADEEAERVIAQLVALAFPDHNLLGEETGNAGRTSDWLWVVDPIDGTTNYSRGIASFCVSIAVYHQGQPVVGVVLNPLLDELFWAVQGQGAFLNQTPLQASRAEGFSSALMVTGFYYERGANIDLTLEAMRAFFAQGILDMRRFGSAALDLCALAAGRVDGFFEIGLNPWDFAAAEFIARQAGARVTDACGQPLGLKKSYVVAGSAALHPQMLAVLSPWRAAQEASPW